MWRRPVTSDNNTLGLNDQKIRPLASRADDPKKELP